MSDITELSLEDLSTSLKKKQFSVVEAAQSFIKKINAHKKLNAFITLDEERLLESAKNSDKDLLGRQRIFLY